MKYLVTYSYPMEFTGESIQGEMLYQGLNNSGYDSKPCNWESYSERKWLYKSFKPEVAIGIGYWGDTPALVFHPQKYGVTPVPWFNADGWVSNYHDVLNSLPLMMVTSNWVKQTYNRDGVTNKNIEVMPIGIDTSKMRPIPKTDESVVQLKKMLRIKPEEKVILTIGGDVSSKGFQETLTALSKIDKEFSNWVYIAKPMSRKKPLYHYTKELELIKEFGFEKKIRYMDGPMSRELMCSLINTCDVYAGPSRIEGFGMIQVEAQSCGKPVLGIDAMGVKDTIEHNKTGFLAKVGKEITLTEEWVYRFHGFKKKQKVIFDTPKTIDVRADPDDLAKYLLRMLTEDELREEMGRAAREHAVKNFDYLKTSKDIAELIEKKLGKSNEQTLNIIEEKINEKSIQKEVEIYRSTMHKQK